MIPDLTPVGPATFSTTAACRCGWCRSWETRNPEAADLAVGLAESALAEHEAAKRPERRAADREAAPALDAEALIARVLAARRVGPHRRYLELRREAVRVLTAQRWTVERIARALQVSHPTICLDRKALRDGGAA